MLHSGDLGDQIGMESCVDLETDPDPAGGGAVSRKPWGMSRRSSMSTKKGKELPPPLPIPTSTVMKRYYTDDRRLIITEEKVESPKYHFTAHRSNGRLTLHLVSSESSCTPEYKCSPCEENDVVAEDEESRSGKTAVHDGGCCAGDGGAKFFGYTNAVRVAATGSCLFANQNQLHAIRPVQT